MRLGGSFPQSLVAAETLVDFDFSAIGHQGALPNP